MTGASPPAVPNVRRGLLLWGIGLVGVGVLYRASLAYWFRLLWTDPEASVGLLVPFAVAYLVWCRRPQLQATPARPSVAGAAVFALVIAGTTVAQLLWFETGTRLGMYCAVVALTWAAWGPRWLRVLAVPLLLLFFAQPLPITISDAITHPLRLLVTQHAAVLLSLGGLPAVAEGVLIHMPRVTLETTAACSGMRGFTASLALAALIADAIRGPRVTTTLLFPGGLIVVYGLNLVRIMIEAARTTISGSPSSEGVHTALGLLTFAGVATILTVWQLKTSARFA